MEYDRQASLEPVSRFLEYSELRYRRLTSEKCSANSKQRYDIVMNTLTQLKEDVNRRTVEYLKDTFQENMKSKFRSCFVCDILAMKFFSSEILVQSERKCFESKLLYGDYFCHFLCKRGREFLSSYS